MASSQRPQAGTLSPTTAFRTTDNPEVWEHAEERWQERVLDRRDDIDIPVDVAWREAVRVYYGSRNAQYLRYHVEKEHYLFVNPSEKRLSRSKTGLADHNNWELYYTSINPEEFEGGGAALAQRYRLRWAIETAYRQLKEEFFPKSASRIQKKREFLAQLAILYNNAWMAANVRAGEHLGKPVKDKYGRYLFSANQFMTAMLDDFHPVDIGELADLSKRSNMVKYGMRKEL